MAAGREAGVMAHWLRTLAALPEDLGSIPSTYMAVHKLPVTPVLGYVAPSHRHACRQNISAHEIKINNLYLKKNHDSLELIM